jgi:hypothetical protein
MDFLVNIVSAAAILVAGALVGKMFLTESRKAQCSGSPWYAPYLTLPGILVLVALAVPLILWLTAD